MTNKNDKNALLFFRKKCKEHKMRLTHQKIMIYKELIKSSDHPSPEKLFTRLKHSIHNLSFDTVYRALSDFNEWKGNMEKKGAIIIHAEFGLVVEVEYKIPKV